jgi:moderate conductance mechanosensitive channel
MFLLQNQNNADEAISKTTDILQSVSQTYFNFRSLLVLALSITIALILGRLIASMLRQLVNLIGKRADKSENLRIVNKLRRYETILVLSIALIRSILFIFALYFWWIYIHPNGQVTGLLGASALLVVIISGALGPTLKDIAAGSVMMAEHWYGVGDHIRAEPFIDAQGVVERVTLRSTRIRGLNGEIIWLNNQHIQGVRVAPKGVISMALEIFVDDLEAGENLIKKTNARLPTGPLLVVTPLTIISSEKVGDKLWHITAIGETAAGREWLLEKSAVDLIKYLDEQNKKQVLAHGPLARFSDSEANKRFSRTIKNARKSHTPKRRIVKKSTTKKS